MTTRIGAGAAAKGGYMIVRARRVGMKRQVMGVLIGALGLGALGLINATTASSTPTTFNWTGLAGSNWSVAANWTPTGPPTGNSILAFGDTFDPGTGPVPVVNKTPIDDIAGTSNVDSIHLTGNGYSISASLTNGVALTNGITASNNTTANTISLPIQLNAPQDMNVSGTKPLTLSGAITGASGNGLDKIGTGELVLAGQGVTTNTYSGSTSVSNGVLHITKDSALGDPGTGTIVGTSGILELSNDISVGAEPLSIGPGSGGLGSLHNLSGNNSWDGTVTLSTSAPLQSTISSAAGMLTVTGKITGTGALLTSGAGTIKLSGSPVNDYVGDTTVHNALLQLDNGGIDTAIPPTTTLNIGDGSQTAVVQHLQSAELPNDVHTVVNAFGSLDNNGFNDTVGAIDLHGGDGTPAHDAQVIGSGTFTLNGDVHAFVVPADTTALTSDISANLDLPAGRNFTVDTVSSDGPQAILTVTGTLADVGGLDKKGAGVLSLSGESSGFTGPITVDAGDLIASTSAHALGDAGGAGHDTTVNGPATIHFVGDITSPENLVLAGTTGSCPSTLIPCLDKVINDLGVNEVDGAVTLASGDPAVNVVSGTLTFGGAIGDSSANGISKDGPGNLVFSSATGNTYTGSTTVNDGKLELNVGAGDAVPGGPLTIGDGVGSAGSALVQLDKDNQIGDTVHVVMAPDGKLSLDGASSSHNVDQIGALTMSGSDVVGTGASQLILGGDVVVNSPLLLTPHPSTITSKLDLNVTGDRTFTIADDLAPNDLTISGVVSGVGSNLVKAGAGLLKLSGANTYDGTTSVNAGTLDANNLAALGATTAGTAVADGASLIYSVTGTYGETPVDLAGSGVSGAGALQATAVNVVIPTTASVTLTGATSIGVASTKDLTISAPISGTGSLVKVGTGSLKLSPLNVDNTFAGSTTVNDGDLHLGACCLPNIAIPHDLVIGDGVGLPNSDRVIPDLTNEIADNAVVTIKSSGQLGMGSSHTDTIGSLAMQGGDITGTSSTLTLSTGGVTQTGTVPSSIASGVTLDLNGVIRTFNVAPHGSAGDDLTIDGVLAHGGLTKTGTGILTLNGANTYTDATSVDAGKLIVGSSPGAIDPASTVSVNAAALQVDGSVGNVTLTGSSTLSGTGTVGTVSVGGSSSVAPGDSPGVLNTGNLTMVTGTTLKTEIGGTSPGQFDSVSVTGTVDVTGATLQVSEVNAFTSATGNSFTIVDNNLTDPVAGPFAGLPEGTTINVNGRQLKISYVGGTGNDIVLSDVGAVPPPPSGGGGGGGAGPGPLARLAGDDRLLTAIAVSKDSFPAAGTGNDIVLSDVGAVPPPPSGGGGGGGPTPDPMTRLSGDDRILTAIAVSKDSFPAAGTAGAVVLSRSDAFADALAGTPLAIAKNAPLLLTAPGGAIDARTFGEIQRALTPGKTVYILGGPSAVDPSVATALQSAGYTVVRYQGNNRYSTAAAVAHDGLNDPPTQFLATGIDFADALAGGAAAANVPGGAVILLTNGSTMAPETSTYMAAHPAVAKFALGGPAAAADPTATAIVGSDRFDTSVKVATTFFNHPVVVGIAYGFNFPDALAGGTHIGAKHGPLLLTDTNALPAKVSTYLTNEKTNINSGYGYGGIAVISNATLAAAQTAYT